MERATEVCKKRKTTTHVHMYIVNNFARAFFKSRLRKNTNKQKSIKFRLFYIQNEFYKRSFMNF